MTWHRIFHNILFISAFTYLLMCPSVHELEDHIRHDVICKTGTKILQKGFNNGLDFTPLKLSNNIQTDLLVQSKATRKFINFLPSNSTLNLLIVSTVRLIL